MGVSAVRRVGALAALALVVSACSSTNGIGGSPLPSGGGTFRERMASLFGSSNETAQGASAATPLSSDFDCPPISIRSGASTLMAHVPNQEPSATNLRYQVSIGQTARECAALGATMTVKVGVQGRLIVGPAGATGSIDVPIRMALVREGPEPKTIWTKLYRVPVSIPPNQPSVTFLHVEEDLTFPLPGGGELDAYVIYLGFDPDGAREQQRRPQKQQQKPPRQPRQAQAN